jgi:hypothetical protein
MFKVLGLGFLKYKIRIYFSYSFWFRSEAWNQTSFSSTTPPCPFIGYFEVTLHVGIAFKVDSSLKVT